MAGVHDNAEYAEQDKAACDGGAVRACFMLSLRYAAGKGVERDLTRAVELSRKACDGGVAEACFDLAIALEVLEGGYLGSCGMPPLGQRPGLGHCPDKFRRSPQP